MLRSVVGAQAANMMLVQCRPDVPISLACSMWFGNSPDQGIIGTASHGDLEGLRSGRQRWSAWSIRWHAKPEPRIETLCRQSIFGAGSR